MAGGGGCGVWCHITSYPTYRVTLSCHLQNVVLGYLIHTFRCSLFRYRVIWPIQALFTALCSKSFVFVRVSRYLGVSALRAGYVEIEIDPKLRGFFNLNSK